MPTAIRIIYIHYIYTVKLMEEEQKEPRNDRQTATTMWIQEGLGGRQQVGEAPDKGGGRYD